MASLSARQALDPGTRDARRAAETRQESTVSGTAPSWIRHLAGFEPTVLTEGVEPSLALDLSQRPLPIGLREPGLPGRNRTCSLQLRTLALFPRATGSNGAACGIRAHSFGLKTRRPAVSRMRPKGKLVVKERGRKLRFGSGGWIRTSVGGFKARGPATRRLPKARTHELPHEASSEARALNDESRRGGDLSGFPAGNQRKIA
jgi:hypothetical protein